MIKCKRELWLSSISFLFIVLILTSRFSKTMQLSNSKIIHNKQPENNQPSINNLISIEASNKLIIDNEKAYLFDWARINVFDLKNPKSPKFLVKIDDLLFYYQSVIDIEDSILYSLKIEKFNNSFIFCLNANNLSDISNPSQTTKNVLFECEILNIEDCNIFVKDDLLTVVFFSEYNCNYNVSIIKINFMDKLNPYLISNSTVQFNLDYNFSNPKLYTIYNRHNSIITDDSVYIWSQYYYYEESGSRRTILYGFLKHLDLTNVSSITQNELLNFNDKYYENILKNDNHLFFLREDGFDVYNDSSLNDNEKLSSFTANDTPNLCLFHDSILFLLCWESVIVLNISDIINIKKIDRYNLVGGDKPGQFTDGLFENNYLYLTKTAYFHYERTYFFFEVEENYHISKVYPNGIILSYDFKVNVLPFIIITGIIIGCLFVIVLPATVLIVYSIKKKRKVITKDAELAVAISDTSEN